MPKPPPPRIPQLGEVRFGIRPNPFSKAQLIESQLAKIDIAQAELFRNLKLNPPATAPRPVPQSETCLPENQEPIGETAGPKSPRPGLRRLKSTPHAAGSPDNKAQPLEPGPQALDLTPPPEKPEILEAGKTIPEHSSQQVIPLPPSRRNRSTANSRSSDKEAEPAGNAPPHYEGHRERLRNRFLKGGIEGLADYELLELILFRAMPRRDLKPLAKDLIARFGSFAQVIAARPERLQETPGLGTAAITEIKIIEAAARRLAKSNIEKRPSMGSFTAVVDYCRTAMAFLDHEEFRVLFLDKKNFLIADEVQGIGTVDHAPVYTREIIRRALELSASAIILVHNHPSGDPQPSTEDIYLTHQIIDIAKKLNVAVHDHLIIGKHGHASLKGMRII